MNYVKSKFNFGTKNMYKQCSLNFNLSVNEPKDKDSGSKIELQSSIKIYGQ